MAQAKRKTASGPNIPEAQRGTKNITARLPPEVIADLEALAERWGVSRTGAVIRLIEEASGKR